MASSASPSVVLGISLGHGDSSAALIVNGHLVAAAEEERFTRVKHYALFPSQAIAYCLKHARLEPRQVEVLAIAGKPRNAWLRKLVLGLRHPALVSSKQRRPSTGMESLSRLVRISGLQRASIVRVEHHHAHLLSARFLANEPEMALLSLDGLGDFVSAAMGRATENGVEILDRIYFPHSLGFFYTAMTQYLGFPHFGDEYKVMGLSSYGKPAHLASLRELVRETEGFGFALNLEAFPILHSPIQFSIEKGQPRIRPFFQNSFLTQAIGIPPRKVTDPLTAVHKDLAKSVQLRFEEVANHLLSQLHVEVGGETLGLAGGCAHNSVWVGKIPRVSRFKRIHVAPASHDAGIAVGAAIHGFRHSVIAEGGHWALLGPDSDELTEGAHFEGIKERSFEGDESLIAWMVNELAHGKIMGLFRGRMEFGPRALGSRSILADPRHPGMRDRLNERVKHREPFRPFAVSVLEEHQGKWFRHAFHAPTMEAVFEVVEDLRIRIPAAVHADHTCRIQSVSQSTQPFYWKLIEAFRKRTGVPMLINTSFNDSEPIVCSAEDAIRCFRNTDLDHLIIGSRGYSKIREAVSASARLTA